MLVLLDQIFAAAGVLILIAWAARSRFSPRPLPLFESGFRDDAILIAALAYFGAALLLSGMLQGAGIEPDSVTAGIVVNNGAQLCGIAACGVLAMHRLPGGLRKFLLGPRAGPQTPRPNFLLLSAAILLIAIGVCPVIRDVTAWLILWASPGYALEEHPTLKALEGGGLREFEVVGLWLGAAVIAPVAEEMFFRGLLQGFLAGATKRTRLAIGLSAVAFGAVHLSQPHAVPALIFLGVLLGWAYVRTGMLFVPIAIHAAFNLKTLVWEAISRTVAAV